MMSNCVYSQLVTVLKTFCSMWLTTPCPFLPSRECISVVDPTPFFRNCVFDMCQYNGTDSVLCDQLQAYTDACQQAGAKVDQWRSPEFCRKLEETCERITLCLREEVFHSSCILMQRSTANLSFDRHKKNSTAVMHLRTTTITTHDTCFSSPFIPFSLPPFHPLLHLCCYVKPCPAHRTAPTLCAWAHAQRRALV